MADSIVDDVQRWAVELGMAREAATALQARIREAWGGCKPYVPKRPALRHGQVIGQQLASGAPLTQAIQAAGVSRATGYRILSRPMCRPR